MTVRNFCKQDYPAVSAIWKHGIETNNATFRTAPSTYEEWDAAHDKNCRLVCEEEGKVVAFAAITPHSGSCAYKGVGEVSVYVDTSYKGNGIGKTILEELIKAADNNGYWTLEAVIIAENTASIALHSLCGFDPVGRRKKIAKTPDGIWHDTVIMERRNNYF